MSDIIINKTYDTYSDVHTYGDELINKLKSVYNRIKQIYTDINDKRMSSLATVKDKQLHIGDKVLLYDPTTRVGLSRKLTIRWKGPYTIIEKRNDINYVINIDGKMSLVHKHRLRLFNDNNNDNNVSLYNDEQESLQEEVNRLSQLELDLRNQKQYKELQLEIAKANQEIINNNNNVNNNNNNNNMNDNVNDNHAIQLVQNEEDNESDIRNNTCIVMQF